MNNENEMVYLSLDDTFQFSCTKQLACFNDCCRDLNQYLSPYDILRLKNQLRISSTQFLERYTLQHTGPETGLPIITLKTIGDDELKCPFVTPSGCSVYENRPSSCRTYPIARIASRSRETGRITEHFTLIREAHCRGFDQGKTQTVRDWIEAQEIAEYNEMNDRLMEIISLKNRFIPGPLDIKSRHLFHQACYDLDGFRILIFTKGILDDYKLKADTLKRLKHDDTILLRVGLQWIKETLFKPHDTSI